MTTIAWDCQTLATDSRCTMGDQIYDEKSQKLFKNVGIFQAVATSGLSEESELFLGVLRVAGPLGEVLRLEVPKGINLLGVTSGVCWMMNHEGFSLLDKPWAIGTGADFAIAAMDHGDSAEDAVRHAATRDLFTNSRIQKYKT